MNIMPNVNGSNNRKRCALNEVVSPLYYRCTHIDYRSDEKMLQVKNE